MEFERVNLDINEDGVACLEFNHPEVLNAVGPRMLGGLRKAIGHVANRSNGVRSLLITGAGRGFCSGANLAGDGSNVSEEEAAGSSLRNGYHPLFFTLKDLHVPIVTAVNGAAAGVGMSFALIGDIVCASKNAFFLQAFARVGLVPDGGATFLLPRLIGWGRAMELSLLAERLPAEKAEEWGIVNRLYEDPAALKEGSMEIATRLANGPASLGLMRQLYWASYQNSYESQIDMEARLQAAAGQTKDSGEGRQAFLEKRQPQFSGE